MTSDAQALIGKIHALASERCIDPLSRFRGDDVISRADVLRAIREHLALPFTNGKAHGDESSSASVHRHHG